MISRNNYYPYLLAIILLLVFFNIGLLSKNKKSKEFNESIIWETNTRQDILFNTIFFQMESENKVIDGSIELRSESGDILKLSDLVSQKPKLILRYSELQCDMCIDHSLVYLKRIADSIGRKNILILASYNSMRDLAIFKRINSIDLPVFQIAEKGLDIPIENYDTPYLLLHVRWHTGLCRAGCRILPIK